VNSQVKSLRESLNEFSFAKSAKKIARAKKFSNNNSPFLIQPPGVSEFETPDFDFLTVYFLINGDASRACAVERTP
jgi:hypothetical protein